MGLTMSSYQTLRLRQDGSVLYLQIYRPEASNTINEAFAIECRAAIREFRDKINILVVEGLPEVFCFGADLQAIEQGNIAGNGNGGRPQDPEILYSVWQDMMSGPYISLAHVKGKANAGGLGFVAASDIVIADNRALFSLSEMLFGLLPACVLPFLIHKIGKQKAHYMTLMTKPVSAEQAHGWGLVDDYGDNSDLLVKKHIQRLSCLSKSAIVRYKSYMAELDTRVGDQKSAALAMNVEIFSDEGNIRKINRYIQTGKYPWEA